MLQQITTNGETYPLNFGIRAMAVAADNLGLTLDKMVRTVQVPDLAYSKLIQMVVVVTAVALTEGARKSGTPHVYTDDDVVDMVDADEALLPKLIQMFQASFGSGSEVFRTATGATLANPGRKPVAAKKPRK